jgi:hypothetical protein
MTSESIRAWARREHWRKQLGNHGKGLIPVSVDAEGIPPGDSDAPASRQVKRSEPNPVMTAVQAITSDLESCVWRRDLLGRRYGLQSLREGVWIGRLEAQIGEFGLSDQASLHDLLG